MTWRNESAFAGDEAGPAAPAALSLRLESLRLPREPGAMAEALQAAIGQALARQHAAHPGFAEANGGSSPAALQMRHWIRQSSLRLTEALQTRLASPAGQGQAGWPGTAGGMAAKGGGPA